MENSILSQLPTELLIMIFKKVDFENLLKCSLVCKEIAEISNECIVKRGLLKISYPFPEEELLSNLVRNYRTLSLVDSYFKYGGEKFKIILEILKNNKNVNIQELNLYIEEADITKNLYFSKFLEQNHQIKHISLFSYGSHKLGFKEHIAIIRSLLPHVNISVFKGFEEDSESDINLISPECIRALSISNKSDEVYMLNTLKKYPNLKSFKYVYKSNNNPINDVIRIKKQLQINEVALDKLDIFGIEYLSIKSPSMSIFRNLKELNINYLGDFYTDDRDSYKLVQEMYMNNSKTLKSLSFLICGNTSNIYKILPAKEFNLSLESLVFSRGYGCYSDTIKFIKLCINQHTSTLKKVVISRLTIDDEIIKLLAEAERLESLTLFDCKIELTTVFPCFTKLKKIDLAYSLISFDSLQSLLSNHIQKTLESLSLSNIRIEVSDGKEIKVFESFYFPFLKKLNLSSDLEMVLCEEYLEPNLLEMFKAPKLEKLNLLQKLSQPLSTLLNFPKLKVLALGNFDNKYEVFETALDDLEILKVLADTDILVRMLECLLVKGQNKLKFAEIICVGIDHLGEFDDYNNSLEIKISILAQSWPDYDFSINIKGERLIKISNDKSTIIVHGLEVDYMKYRQFYENIYSNLSH